MGLDLDVAVRSPNTTTVGNGDRPWSGFHIADIARLDVLLTVIGDDASPADPSCSCLSEILGGQFSTCQLKGFLFVHDSKTMSC